MDPYTREVSRDQALVVRVGIGVGDQVAAGTWAKAVELTPSAPGRHAPDPRERPAPAGAPRGDPERS